MIYVIADRCSKDVSCVQACPVAAIHPTPEEATFDSAEQLYIDPAACIGCGACAVACPVDTIYADNELPENLAPFVTLNAEQFTGIVHVDPDDAGEPAVIVPFARADAPRVAIVGSGPSALYTALALIERGIEVSIFERLPTPFGLIRSGVAPDHQRTRDVVHLFEPALESPLVRWYLGVEIGTDVDADELLEYHHAVVWATGAAIDRPLDIPGEQLPGSHSAREFVSWYNGHPDFANRAFDLSTERAVIIGNGNVALDVARMLTRSPAGLAQTSLPETVLGSLHASAVRRTAVAGRRGPLEAAFTNAELIALDATEGLELRVDHRDLRRATPMRPQEVSGFRTRLIHSLADTTAAGLDRSVDLRFLLTPLSIDGRDRVESVTFRHNELVEHEGELTLRPTGSTEVLETGLVFRATGANGAAITGLPFDAETGRIPNLDGSVVDPETGMPAPGHYCVGWIKRGPTGALGTNRQDAASAVESILTHLGEGRLSEPPKGREDLESRMDRIPHRLNIDDWRRIEQAERDEGARTGRRRATLNTVTALFDAAAVGNRPVG